MSLFGSEEATLETLEGGPKPPTINELGLVFVLVVLVLLVGGLGFTLLDYSSDLEDARAEIAVLQGVLIRQDLAERAAQRSTVMVKIMAGLDEPFDCGVISLDTDIPTLREQIRDGATVTCGKPQVPAQDAEK